MPNAAWIPVPVSPMVGPGLSGSVSDVPVIAIAPPVACAIMSKLFSCAQGPVLPNPLTLQNTMSGLCCTSTSKPRSKRSMVPSVKFSTTTSKPGNSRRKSSRPFSLFRSRVTERLLLLSAMK